VSSLAPLPLKLEVISKLVFVTFVPLVFNDCPGFDSTFGDLAAKSAGSTEPQSAENRGVNEKNKENIAALRTRNHPFRSLNGRTSSPNCPERRGRSISGTVARSVAEQDRGVKPLLKIAASFHLPAVVKWFAVDGTVSSNTRALVSLRIAVGALFLVFAEYKVFGTQFTLGGGFQSWIHRFLEQAAYPFMAGVLRDFVLPHATAVAFLVAYGELAIGLGLVLGVWVRAASVCGMVYMLILPFSSNYPGADAPFW
jgi:uncharacterized membrane protein YphA (DoxX/SURF4 family)